MTLSTQEWYNVWGAPIPGRVPKWGCLMGVRPREGRLGEARPPPPWCRGVARAREDAGLARGRDEGGGSAGGAADASAVAAISSLPIKT